MMDFKKISQFLFPSQGKELKAVWRIGRGEWKGYLIGTAHFFRYRLSRSLRNYIEGAQYVLFEGPLDEKSMSEVRRRGSSAGGAEAIYEALDPQVRKKIHRLMQPLFQPENDLILLNPLGRPPSSDPLAEWFKAHRPWLAFFEIWAQFLRTQGWRYSVDLEAYHIAQRLGKEIHFLETIAEQIEAMEGIPIERFIRFLEKIDHWKEYSNHHLRNYLEGNIDALMNVTQAFPTRCPSIVDHRDPVFFERMGPFFEKGKTLAFVGTIHIPGLIKKFLAGGYTIEPDRSPSK